MKDSVEREWFALMYSTVIDPEHGKWFNKREELVDWHKDNQTDTYSKVRQRKKPLKIQ